jgi:hypothetical protein
MYRHQKFCWFLYAVEVLTDITQIFVLSKHFIPGKQLRSITFSEMDSTLFSNKNVCCWDLCNICIYFHIVYLKAFLVANSLVCPI